MNGPQFKIGQEVKIGGWTGTLRADYEVSPKHGQFVGKVEGMEMEEVLNLVKAALEEQVEATVEE